MSIKQTDGCLDLARDKHCYFLASHPHILVAAVGVADYMLVALNDIETPKSITDVQTLIDSDVKVLFDSGIFNLANQHAQAHNLTHDQALNLAPDEIDGFDDLYERYADVIQTLGHDRLWGYIELDQGGAVNKRKTRARLEADGLRPIPVYHPLLDGWDYFDELASQYDRICVGNVVQASTPVRTRILATVHERAARYPHLWIHLLGYTLSQYLNAYPVASCDSSTWLAATRWTINYRESAMLKPTARMPIGFRYSTEAGQHHSRQHEISAYASTQNLRNWRAHIAALDRERLSGGING